MGDKKPTPLSGVKSEDSSRDGKVDDVKLVAAADQNLNDSRGTTFGDTTSSSSGANNPGQHGRDGGEVNGQTNNPAPSDAAVAPEAVEADEEDNKEEGAKRTL